MKKNFLLTFVLLLSLNLFAQNQVSSPSLKKINFTEFIDRLENGRDSVFTLKNCIVTMEDDKNQRYKLFDYRFLNKESPKDTIHVYKEIFLENVHFERVSHQRHYGFVNFEFHKEVKFKDVENLAIYNCKFDESFSLRNLNSNNLFGENFVFVQNSAFHSKFLLTDDSEANKSIINISECTFNYFGNEDYSKCDANPLMQILATNTYIFQFNTNKMNYDKATFAIQFYDMGELFFMHNEIHSKFWNYFFINNIKSITLNNNRMKTDLLFAIDKLNPEYSMQWPLTENKIIPLYYIFSSQESFRDMNNEMLDSVYHNNRVSDVSYYKNELTQLSKFSSYFKAFHDRQSANDVYIKIKDLETERLAYLYKNDKSFENYFELSVNRFLKRFSNYGTSPSKIVSSSLSIILLFAFLFLFSTNSWNKLDVNKFNKGIKQSIDYFVSENSIIQSFKISQNSIDKNNMTKNALLQNKTRVPKVFSFFTLSTLSVQAKIFRMKRSFWQRLDVVKNTWESLPNSKRIFYSIILFIVLLGYFLFKIISILLNALTLSINSFTTLGFGEIPIKGIGRYLAIVEGFIGWVFLTLFSVTLISQILS